jgi:RNA polymerase sigma factor for flagellar operon FliA
MTDPSSPAAAPAATGSAASAGSAAPTRDALIEQHRSYAHALAGQLWRKFGSSAELDELRAAAELGLVEAADRYDFRNGVAFQTFAHYRIRGAIFDCLHKLGRLDRSAARRRKFEEAADAATASEAAGVPATPAGSAAAAADSDAERAARAAESIRRLGTILTLSLDAAEDFPIVDTQAEPPDGRLQAEESRVRLAEAVSRLDEQERSIVRWYYHEELTMEEIGRRLGKGKPWISRLHSRIIAKLARALAEPE